VSADVVGWAAFLELPSGRYFGRRLGALVTEQPGYVRWLARESRDPAVRAAARVLLDRLDAGDDIDLEGDLHSAAVAAARSAR
jgi:hypothetical protein